MAATHLLWKERDIAQRLDAGWELVALRPRKQPVLLSRAGAQHLVGGAAIRAKQS